MGPPGGERAPGGGDEIVYGRRAVEEARRGPRKVIREWSVPTVGEEELRRLAGSADHQGVVAEVEPYSYADPERMLSGAEDMVLALDQIQDPGNLGAICRSAEAAGAAGVVIPARRSAAVTPAVCKASAGAVEHLDVARVTNLARWLEAAKERGAWVYGAEAGAATPYHGVELKGRIVLVLGGEQKGLRPRTAKVCDALVSIPLVGRTASLNVAAAAAVLLFEALRQREATGGGA